MAAKAKLSTNEWRSCRERWEGDPREGYAWLVAEMGLPVSAPAVRKVAARDGWKKRVNGSKDEPPKVSHRNRGKVSETMSETIETLPNRTEKTPNTATKGWSQSEGEERSVGRPSLYRPEFAGIARNYCLLGATDAQLAEFFEVCESTINRWKIDHPEFCESLKGAKAMADAQVAESLYRLATGYTHPETKVFVNQGQVIEHTVTRHYPPDIAACIFWLKNRQPELWRDKVAVEKKVDLHAIPWDELEKISQKAMAEAEEHHRHFIEGRAERLGLKIDYASQDAKWDGV